MISKLHRLHRLILYQGLKVTASKHALPKKGANLFVTEAASFSFSAMVWPHGVYEELWVPSCRPNGFNEGNV
jgi:hypothetical protein